MKKLWVVLIVFSAIAAACGSVRGAPLSPTSAPTATPTNLPVLGTPPQTLPLIVPAATMQAAIANLAKGLGIAEQQISFVSVMPVTWPNGCMGIQRPGVMCTINPVPGFRILLSAKGTTYEVHTNQDGSVVAPEEPVQAPDAARHAAIHQLAKNLGISDGDVKVVSSAIVEWPDSCLGVAQQGVMCSQIVTPGYLFTLEAGGRQYEYHTNQDASMTMPGTLALDWKQQGGIAGLCEQLTVYLSGEIYAQDCKSGDGRTGVLKAAERAQLYSWIDKYSNDSINVSDPQGAADAMSRTADLFGTAQQTPSKGDELAIFNFGQMLYRTLYP